VTRLFAAWYPSPLVAAQLHDACAPLRAAAPVVRWMAPDRLHCTMRFFGDVTAAQRNALSAALAEAAALFDPLAVTIRGLGAFPSWRRARVLWAGVAPDPKFELLHHEVEQRVMALGFAVEGRIFRPHLTLARVRDDAPLAAIREAARGVRVRIAAEVATVSLMASHASADGHVHTAVTTVELGRA
jgi:2'-5' RNA ligase